VSEKPPGTISTADLLAEAEQLEAEARARLARAKQIRDAVEMIERLRADGPLTSVSIDTIGIDTMSSTDTQKVAGPKFASRHPLPTKAKALGKSIPDVAAEISKALKRKVPRTTVRSWYASKDGDAGRPIPADAVKFFEADPWGIPRAAWKNGIKDTD
jgi:hypothetical protein